MRSLVYSLCLVPLGMPAMAADGPLKEVAYISEGLIIAAMVVEIDSKCDTIDVRLLRGINFLSGLKNHARDLGYSAAEIDAFINDAEEKARLEAIARDRLAALGVTASDNASYCTVGEAEIAANTSVGRLLR